MIYMNFSHRLQAPPVLSGLAFAFGASLCVTIGFVPTKKELKKIEQQNVQKVSEVDIKSPWPYALWIPGILAAGSGVTLLAFYIMYYQPFWIFLGKILFPFSGAFLLTLAVCYWRWERRTTRKLFEAEGRIYAETQVCNTTLV